MFYYASTKTTVQDLAKVILVAAGKAQMDVMFGLNVMENGKFFEVQFHIIAECWFIKHKIGIRIYQRKWKANVLPLQLCSQRNAFRKAGNCIGLTFFLTAFMLTFYLSQNIMISCCYYFNITLQIHILLLFCLHLYITHLVISNQILIVKCHQWQ